MMKREDLLKDLLKQAEELPLRDESARDSVSKRSEMLIRRLFGDSSPYVESLRKIQYRPRVAPTEEIYKDQIDAHLPDLAKGLRRLERARKRGRVPQKDVDRIYPRLPSISVDHGIMEKSRRVAMLPAEFEWSDIGDWDAVAELWPSDGNGNRTRDPIIAIDASGNVVATRGKPVALIGVSDLAVVDAGDALLICPRQRAQDVRRVVAALGPAGLGKLS